MPISRALIAASLPFLAACASRTTPVTMGPPVTVTSAPAAEPVRLPAPDDLATTSPAAVGMDERLGDRLDALARGAIASGIAPGLAIVVGRHGQLVHAKGYGTTDWPAGSPPVDLATRYDLASLTKVIATTTAAMLLEEEGRLDLSQPVRAYLPEFDAPDKAAITVRMLLTHTGGLEAYAALYRTVRGRADYLREINTRPLRHAPGSATIYSDWDMVLLQLVIERVAGQSLDTFVAERVFRPLDMRESGFVPDTGDAALRRTIAPTAVDTSRGGLLWGTVHDGNAWAIGGVSGHAGLFGSARDVAAFSAMLLNGGTLRGTRILQPQTIARWTSRQGAGSSRALGWDTPAAGASAGRFFSLRSFGHTGFTGTSLWIDPERGLFVVILANRVHSRGSGEAPTALRRAIADAAQQAIVDAPLVEWEARLAR